MMVSKQTVTFIVISNHISPILNVKKNTSRLLVKISKSGHSESAADRQRSFAAFIVEKSRETAYVGEVMLKGPCLAICGRATKISSEAVWRNIYYLTEESPYIWLVSILVICSPPRLVRLG